MSEPVNNKICRICGAPTGKYSGLCRLHYDRLKRGLTGEELYAPSRVTRSCLDLLDTIQPTIQTTIAPPSTITSASASDLLEQSILTHLRNNRQKAISVEALSDHFNVGIGRVRAALSSLRQVGFNIAEDAEGTARIDTQLPAEPSRSCIDIRKLSGTKLKFGFTADNHLCSKYARMDVLNALYDIWERDGVETVLQGGNMIDGEASFNRFDLLTRPGLDAQAEYLVNEWPYRDGIVTKFVCGDDHEGWYVQRDGINICQYLQNKAEQGGRNDLEFVGYMEHTFDFKGENPESRSTMSLMHAGGGSAYAHSYTVQKIVESYQPNEKPTILLAGHFHKFEQGYPRAVHTVQGACTQDQTPFMRKKRIEAMIGGVSLEFTVDGNVGTIQDFGCKFHPFYDRDFYHRWGYIWSPK